MKLPRLLAVWFLIFGTSFIFMPVANAELTGQITVTCANEAGEARVFNVGWDSTLAFFEGKGNIAALFCTIGTQGQWKTFISTTAPESTWYYNGIAPTPIVNPSPEPSAPAEPSPSPSPTETATVVVETATPVVVPSPAPEPPPSPVETQTPTIVETSTLLSETSTVPSEPVPSEPLPEPVVIIQPQPVVVPPPPEIPEPSPTPPEPQPEPEVAPEPVPEPEPEAPLVPVEEPPAPAEEPPVPVEEPPVEAEEPPPPAEEPPLEEVPAPVIPEPAPEPALEPPAEEPEPPAVATEDSTPEERAEVAATLIEEARGEAVTAEAIQAAGLTYEDLPPETPVEVRKDEDGNEVVITAEVAAALVVLESPAALLDAIFTDPTQALLAIASIGADMSDEERTESEKIIVASVIAGQAAVTAAGAAGAYRRKP